MTIATLVLAATVAASVNPNPWEEVKDDNASRCGPATSRHERARGQSRGHLPHRRRAHLGGLGRRRQLHQFMPYVLEAKVLGPPATVVATSISSSIRRSWIVAITPCS